MNLSRLKIDLSKVIDKASFIKSIEPKTSNYENFINE